MDIFWLGVAVTLTPSVLVVLWLIWHSGMLETGHRDADRMQ